MTQTSTEEARQGVLYVALAGQAFEGSTPEELFAVVDALDGQSALRRALTDPATAPEARQQMADRLLQGKVSGQTLWIVQQAVAQRWNSGRGMADALERQAVRGVMQQAEDGGYLDEVSDQLYGFLSTVQGDAALKSALADRSRSMADRQQLVRQLLQGKVHGWVVLLATRAVAGRERNFQLTAERYLQWASELRNRNVARVTVARALDEEQATRLRRALSRMNGRVVDLQVQVDPSVIGGVRVELGDSVIEGTVADRLEQVHRQLS